MLTSTSSSGGWKHWVDDVDKITPNLKKTYDKLYKV
jgi:hypothetical protein